MEASATADTPSSGSGLSLVGLRSAVPLFLEWANWASERGAANGLLAIRKGQNGHQCIPQRRTSSLPAQHSTQLVRITRLKLRHRQPSRAVLLWRKAAW
jgi:hypothetical protein